jgi:hypothetical protein
MVGVRVEPDGYDLVVWKLDEAAAPFVNSSTSGSAPSHATSDLATLSGTINLQQPSPFASSGTNSAVQFTGNNSGSPRNFISGANNFIPQPPITISLWYYQRIYDFTGFTQHGLSKQTTTGVWSGVTFNSIAICQNRRYASLATQYDASIVTNSSGNGGSAVAVQDVTIPLNTWCHVGLTYDGTTIQHYINGNNVATTTTSPTGNIYYSGTPGPWFIGAIPSGSGNPEESQAGFCDIRIANVVRPQSYFANIYQQGMLNTNTQISVTTTFYKMRAYDLYLTTTPVYWVDNEVSYDKAPSSPSGVGLGPIELLETWTLLNI